MLNFKGSRPNGRKAEVRQSEAPYASDGYSVFTWFDDGSGVILWREKHELSWDEAYAKATDWLNS